VVGSAEGGGTVDWTFEDFTVGRRAESPGRTVTEADVVAFAGLTGDYHPLHTDAVYAAATQFGQRIAHGLLGLGLAAGLLARIGLLAPSVLALLGVRDWRFVAPVPLGETVRARAVVRAARPSADQPDRGVVTLEVELVRADEVVAQRGELTLLVRRRAA
jgi:acyl dehydratase